MINRVQPAVRIAIKGLWTGEDEGPLVRTCHSSCRVCIHSRHRVIEPGFLITVIGGELLVVVQSPAPIAPKPQETEFQNPAFQERPKFVFDKLRHGTLSFQLPGELFQFPGDDRIHGDYTRAKSLSVPDVIAYTRAHLLPAFECRATSSCSLLRILKPDLATLRRGEYGQ